MARRAQKSAGSPSGQKIKRLQCGFAARRFSGLICINCVWAKTCRTPNAHTVKDRRAQNLTPPPSVAGRRILSGRIYPLPNHGYCTTKFALCQMIHPRRTLNFFYTRILFSYDNGAKTKPQLIVPPLFCAFMPAPTGRAGQNAARGRGNRRARAPRKPYYYRHYKKTAKSSARKWLSALRALLQAPLCGTRRAL